MNDDDLIELGSVSGQDNRGCLPMAWILLAIYLAVVAAGVWWAVS